MAASTGTYRLGPDGGRVVIKTTRAGLAARVGHDLTLDVTRWSADITVPGDDLSAATVTAELDLGSLVVREGTGGARPLTDSDRRDIESTMRKILGAGAQATAAFRSTRVIPAAGGGGAIEGTLTLNGRSQPARLQLTAPAPAATAARSPSSSRTSASSPTQGSSARSSCATRWSPNSR